MKSPINQITQLAHTTRAHTHTHTEGEKTLYSKQCHFKSNDIKTRRELAARNWKSEEIKVRRFPTVTKRNL